MNDQTAISAWQLDDDSAAAYESYLVGRFFRRWAVRLATHADPVSGERVLDAGCGTGIVARTMASHMGPGSRITGIDPNDGMLAEARRQDRDGAVSWQTGALEEPPFDDGSFDLVLSQQVLQFVPDRARALKQMHRVLAPGGRMVFALLREIDCNPSYEALAACLDRHAGKEAGDMMRSPFGGPDTDTLRGELRAAGFGELDISHDILDVRFPSPGEYLREEAACSPLAGPLGTLDDDRLAALLADLVPALAPFTDDHGVVFPMETRFVRAYRD